MNEIQRIYTDEELSSLADDVFKTSMDKKWWKVKDGRVFIEPGDLEDQLLLIVCELAEAFEEYRKPDVDITKIYVVPIGATSATSSKDRTRHPTVEDYRGLLPGAFKPDGFPVEVADAYIRVLQLARAADYVLLSTKAAKISEDLERPCYGRPGQLIWSLIADMVKTVEVSQDIAMAVVLAGCERIAHEVGFDLRQAITLKAAYNKTRPERHGGKRA